MKEKKSFNDVISDIEYLYVENSFEKSHDEVADEIREKIRETGWPCLEEYESEGEWLEKHPWLAESECEDCAITRLEFLTENNYSRENDVAFSEFYISFYGKWGEIGTFIVE